MITRWGLLMLAAALAAGDGQDGPDVFRTLPGARATVLYQEGDFRQMLDQTGWQVEIYPYNDSNSLPIRPGRSRNGAWLHVGLEFPGRRVLLRVWEARVGRVLDAVESPGPGRST